MLDQDEIDALLKMAEDTAPEENPVSEAPAGDLSDLTREEIDAIGEVGNIALGASATTLSTLLNQKVSITSPRVEARLRDDLLGEFVIPYLVVEVGYTEGLEATTLLVVKIRDACIIADLMMGNDGTNPPETLDELSISAASEAMNQMVGSSATSLSQMVGRTISISPPVAHVLEEKTVRTHEVFSSFEDVMITINFNMKIGDLVDTEIMQIMTLDIARKEADLLWSNIEGGSDALSTETPADTLAVSPVVQAEPAPPMRTTTQPPEAPPPVEQAPALESPAAPPPAPRMEDNKLNLILDIPLKVTVILGRTRRPIKEVLGLAPGAIVELAALADEPVEILVNGVTVAKGEVVVVNENFGVRITSIMSPRERVEQLYGNR
ncbi:MAG: flagellar motor switch phosphatase FliY [Desulforudis sp.]|jgi:flagellar motor switch protein FliN/FliY|nr:MAG: flagellar motor switch phosphatase FliY [Desulforudis sp.]